MNTKKAVWINKPEIRRITLHSVEFASSGSHCVFFVLGSSGEMDLTLDGPAAFAMMHTPQDYVILKENETIVSFKGVRSAYGRGPGRKLHIVKDGCTVEFSSEGFSLSVENSAFRDSASIGAVSEGTGIVSLDVF